MIDQTCSRPECTKLVPQPPFTIQDRPGEFCSRECVDLVIGGKKNKKVRVPNETMPGTGLSKHVCDNPDCGLTIRITMRGRDGEYCSKACKDKVENSDTEVQTNNEEDNTMTNGTAAAVATETKKAPKGKAKAVKVSKTKAAKKGKAKAAGGNKGLHYTKESVIHLKAGKENPYTGLRAKMFKLIKNGMTVGDFLEARRKADLGAGASPIIRAEAAGLISISKK